MNLHQSINIAFLMLNITALLLGFVSIKERTPDVTISTWIFMALFVLLRLKIFFDDHYYFKNAKKHNKHFQIGFILAISSWLLWAVSGYKLSVITESYFFLGAALTVSLIWIIAVALRKGAYKEQYYWIASNAVIVFLLWMSSRRSAAGDDVMTWVLLGICILIVLIDYVVSKSLEKGVT